MTTNKNSVVRKLHGTMVQKELEATAAAILPGMILERTSTANRVQAQSTSGGNATPMVALEDSLKGNGIDDAYLATAGTPVQVWYPRRGDEGHCILVDGQNVSIGDYLECDGTGRLQVHTADVDASHDSDDADAATTIYTSQIVAIALEAKDLSDSSGAEDSGSLDYDYRISVEFV
jgi:hypothetical protein